jgi:hypothetical protein
MSEDELNELLDAARVARTTPEQREAQRRSFVYGNTRLENELITRNGRSSGRKLVERERTLARVVSRPRSLTIEGGRRNPPKSRYAVVAGRATLSAFALSEPSADALTRPALFYSEAGARPPCFAAS